MKIYISSLQEQVQLLSRKVEVLTHESQQFIAFHETVNEKITAIFEELM